jgi:glutamine amidotransferase
MCRLYGFRSTAPTRVDCSLVNAQNALLAQSRLDERGYANADGWGIAHYRNGAPAVLKRETAAHSDAEYRATATRITAATLVAHVRQATVGRARLENTHPFHLGPWTFAHNGTLTAFDSVAPRLGQEMERDLLENRRGTTDSELLFLWLIARMAAAGVGPGALSRHRGRALEVFGQSVGRAAELSRAEGAEEPARLNFVLTDGRVLLAARWGNTLHVLQRQGVLDCDICGDPHVEPRHRDGYRAAMVASEPITNEAWTPVPDRHALAIDAGMNVTLAAIQIP